MHFPVGASLLAKGPAHTLKSLQLLRQLLDLLLPLRLIQLRLRSE
jgi:hypothetical protein